MTKAFYEKLENKRKVNYLYLTNGAVKVQQIINDAITNFTTSLRYPIHRWYYYKEGFSSILIENLLKDMNLNPESKVIDPFCGGGTTPLVCMYQGIPSTGLEINPFSSFLAKTKTRKYQLEDLESFRKHVKKISRISGRPSILPPKMGMVDRLFSPYVMDDLLLHKEYILNVSDNVKAKNLLMLGWLATLEDLSNYRKAGNGLKLKTPTKRNAFLDQFLQKPAIVRDSLLSQYRIMLEDLQGSLACKEVIEPVIHEPSVGALDLEKVVPSDWYSLSVFSPTYANCFDYCEIYKVELWMGDFVKNYTDLRRLRERSLKSHLNMKLENPVYTNEAIEETLSYIAHEKLWDKRIPLMLQCYFDDMYNVFKSHMRILKKRGKMVVVVGNSAYGGVVIPTDLIFCEIAESLGFRTLHVDVMRPEITSSQQFRILEKKEINQYMRESILYFEKSEGGS